MDQTHKPETFDDHEQWYGSSLKTVSQSADILYTYNTLIHGYSATLTAEEAESLEKQLGVLSVLPETVYQLHTTRSPLFLGLEQKAQQSDLLPASTSVSEVTVGVLDTGVWPELESFNDKGLGPVPTTWKGTCEVGKKFDSTKCNKKLIGARYFSKGYESPRDDDGHGSHTSTTAAGSVVSGANLFGFATGTARGMAPQARVAVYKVCWLGGCFGSDILAAMEKAVEDGVNVISMSIDVIAPGVNILAGWRLANDTRSVSFNIISGTSMSCPHVSGLAALIKAAHQDWSPAAIRSALMTTAYTAYKTGGKPATPFDYGAGHVNPVAALDPGLVYDATVEDYFGFLCALNYTAELIKRATNKGFTCDSRKTYSLGDFNYPSFSVALQTASGKGYSRTLTNVGSPGTYKVALASETKAVKMTVQPATLTFGQEKEKKSYTVTFTAASMPSGTTSFAHLEWSDGKHMVHSPIAFTWA
ncbi:Subtilisin-like protease SBT1.7 [Linum grandiflorum]